MANFYTERFDLTLDGIIRTGKRVSGVISYSNRELLQIHKDNVKALRQSLGKIKDCGYGVCIYKSGASLVSVVSFNGTLYEQSTAI